MSLTLLSLAALLTPDAAACGAYGVVPLPEIAVTQVAEQHFSAIQRADRKALSALWLTRSGTVTRVDGDQEITNPVRQSIDLWTAAPEPGASWEILGVDMVDAETSTVTAKLTWKGSTYDEELTLVQHRGDWRLVAKTYSTDAPAASRPSFGGY